MTAYECCPECGKRSAGYKVCYECKSRKGDTVKEESSKTNQGGQKVEINVGGKRKVPYLTPKRAFYSAIMQALEAVQDNTTLDFYSQKVVNALSEAVVWYDHIGKIQMTFIENTHQYLRNELEKGN